jgi:hypothetical protein
VVNTITTLSNGNQPSGDIPPTLKEKKFLWSGHVLSSNTAGTELPPRSRITTTTLHLPF